jgi:hypothetical protein
MSGSIRTITDEKEYQELFNRHFLQGVVFLKAVNGNLKIAFYGYTQGIVALKIPYLKNMPESCLIFSRIGSITTYVQLKYIQKREDEVYLFKPLKMQSISVERREGRTVLEENEKSLIFLTDIITDFDIEKTIALESRKTDRIRNMIISEIQPMFQRIKVYFCNEGMSDPRMKYFYKLGRPYLIKDFNDPAMRTNPEYRNFVENILSRDYNLINRKNLISEISVPVAYKNAIPFGYIQVNNTAPVVDASMDLMRKLSATASELFIKDRIFAPSQEKLLISDISKTGLGIVFKDRTLIRFFKEKSYVHFNLILPGKQSVQVFAVVRNVVFLENKVIKVGCEILGMDEASRQKYSQFVEKK